MVARRITIDLDENLDRDLSRVARDRGVSEEVLVRETLERAVRDYHPYVDRPAGAQHVPKRQPGESVLDALKRAGLIGCIKNGPPDLSTNPKYMEGFGE